jgi:uncharacterized protein (DUF2249 family)
MTSPATDAGATPERVVDTRLPDVDNCVALANSTVDGLTPGASFVLVADHDPIGLCYMLDVERPGTVSWQVLEEGPPAWRVRFVKPAA